MDTEEDYRRQRWEETNLTVCPDCGAEVKLGEPYMYGTDADGNRGIEVRDIDEEHKCD